MLHSPSPISILILAPLALLLEPTAVQARAQKPSNFLASPPSSLSQLSESPTGPLLSDVMSKFQFGFHQEPQSSQELLIRQARTYVLHRTKKLSKTEETQLVESCKKEPSKNPFCLVMQDDALDDERSNRVRKIKSKLPHRFSPIQIARWIRDGALDQLKSLREAELHLGMRRIESPHQLIKVSENLIQAPACDSPELSTFVGGKTEELLPDPDARKRAIQLYSKASECNTTSEEVTLRARFRLSLLKIWDGKCTEVLPELNYLTTHSTQTHDYRSRALFWQMSCGNQNGNSELSQRAKDALLEQYPFSLHSLLVQMEDPQFKLPHTTKADSPILFRAPQTEAINTRLQAAEALLAIHELRYAREVLLDLEPKLTSTPASFRLYFAGLLSHLDETLKKFRLLSGIFKEEPSLVSKAALELYYPKKHTLSRSLASSSVDSMLLLSLIRQESAFDHRARSSAGAIGLMQIMPYTARKFKRIRSPRELYDPSVNLQIGSRYFSYLMKTYGGDAELALAAYNAGPKRVEQWVKRYPVKDRVLFLDLIPFRETREYVSSIARNYFWYVTLYSDPTNASSSSGSLTEGEETKKTLGKVFSVFGKS